MRKTRWAASIGAVALASLLTLPSALAAPEAPADDATDPGPATEAVSAEVQDHLLTEQPGADGNTVFTTGGLRVVGATWEGEPDAVDIHIRSHDGEEWSAWQHLHVHHHTDEDGAAGTEPLVVDGEQIEARMQTTGEATSVELSIIDPGTGAADAAVTMMPMSSTGPPRINSREQWGADETIRSWRPQAGRVTGAVVHHTAGTNDYTRDQVPAIIRGIYTFHAQTRGWGDIGYNVIVDRFGQAWEGRYGGIEHPVIGAHAVGANQTTFGISVMGDFSARDVPPAAFQQVARVIGWKFSLHGITTQGSATGPSGPMDRIVGHRNVQNTACPGQRFYARLGELRGLVEAYQRVHPPRSVPPYREVRLAGADRYETAVEASRWSYGRPRTVLVATAAEFADALAAGPGADRAGAPVLLVQPDRVPVAVQEELQRIRPERIVVLGGRAAISEPVISQLRKYGDVERLQGTDRYRTAAAISREFFGSSTNEVWISSAEDYADALTGGAGAAHRNAPMLLTRAAALPGGTQSELERMSPDRVMLVGGSAVVDEQVMAQVRALLPDAQVERLSGSDRYGTATAVADDVWPSGSSTVFYATGRDWRDALSGVPAAAQRSAPLLLLRGDCAPATIRSSTENLDPTLVFLLGGTAAVSDGAIRATCR